MRNPNNHFNSRHDERYKTPSIDRLKKHLNGFDPKNMAFDDMARYGYTGKAWIVWLNGTVLAFGEAGMDYHWIERLCTFLNGVKGSWFKDLGFEAPKPGSAAYERWQAKEAVKHGFNRFDENVFEASEVIEALEVLT